MNQGEDFLMIRNPVESIRWLKIRRLTVKKKGYRKRLCVHMCVCVHVHACVSVHMLDCCVYVCMCACVCKITYNNCDWACENRPCKRKLE